MNRTCPNCHASNVRRSSTPRAEVTWRNRLFSPYRCRECLVQFWVVSHKTYAAAGAFVGAIVLVVICVFVMEMVFSRQSAPPPPKGKRAEAVPLPRAAVAVPPATAGLGIEPPRVTPPASRATPIARESARS